MKKIFICILTVITCISCKEDEIPVPTALYVGEDQIEAAIGGETKTIDVKTTASDLALKATDVSWCKTTLNGTTLTIEIQKNNSLAARETSIELVTPDRSLTVPIKQAGQPTIPIEITDAWASSFQPDVDGEGEIKYSYDKDMTTLYHSHWTILSDKYELIYYLKGAPTLALMTYYPRTNGGNGTFGKIEIYASTVNDPENFKKIMDYDCGLKATPSYIELKDPVPNAYAAKIIVDASSSKGGLLLV